MGNPQLGVGNFGTRTPERRRASPLNDPALGSPGYMLMTSTPTTIYIAFDVSPSAQFSFPTLSPPNEVTGITRRDPARFAFLPANAGDSAVFVGTSAVASPDVRAGPTVNQVYVNYSQLSLPRCAERRERADAADTLQTSQNTAHRHQPAVDHTVGVGRPRQRHPIDQGLADPNGAGIFDAAVTTGRQRRLPEPAVVRQRHVQQRHGHDQPEDADPGHHGGGNYFVTYDVSQFASPET